MHSEKQTIGDTTPTTIAPAINAWSAEYLDNMRLAWKENPNAVTKDWQDFFNPYK